METIGHAFLNLIKCTSIDSQNLSIKIELIEPTRSIGIFFLNENLLKFFKNAKNEQIEVAAPKADGDD
jgi:hypothetical protein